MLDAPFAVIQRRINPRCGVISTAKGITYSISATTAMQAQVLEI
jgi:hypothetical protein